MELYVNVKTIEEAEKVLSNEGMKSAGLDVDDFSIDDIVLHITRNHIWEYAEKEFYSDKNIISFDEYIKKTDIIYMTTKQLEKLTYSHYHTKSSFSSFYEKYSKKDVNPFDNLSEEDLMKVWLEYAIVKIIPERKWFVRSRLQGTYANEHMWLIDYENEYGTPEYYEKVGIPSYAKKFDTREEAEKWTVPATEAVLLEVKDNG